MTKAYLSGPIIHLQDRKDDFYRIVVDTLNEMGIEIFAAQFQPLEDPTDIFERDISEVKGTDLVIAEVSNPSHGVGMEIMLAIELSKPILMFHDRNVQRISHMVLGAKGKVIFPYGTPEDVVDILCSLDLKHLKVQNCPKCGAQIAEVFEKECRCVVCKGRWSS
jgi:hypothetical protein